MKNAIGNFNIDFWDTIKQNAEQWWKGQLDRPLIQARLKKSDQPEKLSLPLHEFTSFYDLSVPAQDIIKRWDIDLNNTIFLGDAFPHAWPNFGPGVIAAFLGAKLENGQETVWFHPQNNQAIQDISFELNQNNVWFKRITDIIKAGQDKWNGYVQIGMTDLGGNLDIVSCFRPSEKLLLDLYDSPEHVKRLVWQAHDAWWQAFESLAAISRSDNPGYSSWAGIFSGTPHYMLQCDFSYMISPDMFDRFVKPELQATADKLTNVFYHLDGPGQLVHLDSILEIDSIKGIQWIPGEGSPDISRWPDVYRKIHNAGKLIQIFNHQYPNGYEILDILVDQIGDANNIIFMINDNDTQRAKVTQLLEKYL